MSIAYERQIVAECDICGVIEITSVCTIKSFTRALRDKGWKIGKECICDKCRAKEVKT